MKKIKVFENEEFGKIRTTIIENEPWFVGKDVADILGYERANNAIRNHIDDEDKLMHQISASGQNRNMIFINESGVYSLILSSKLPGAKEFKHWITAEVIPTIRKTGGYITPQKLQDIFTDSDCLSVFLNNMIVLNEENKKLRNDFADMENKANYFDKLMNKELLLNFRTTAKELKVGQTYFIETLLK